MYKHKTIYIFTDGKIKLLRFHNDFPGMIKIILYTSSVLCRYAVCYGKGTGA